MENRRLLLAALLSAILLILWNMAFPPTPPVRQDSGPEAGSEPTGQGPVSAPAESSERSQPEPLAEQTPASPSGGEEQVAEAVLEPIAAEIEEVGVLEDERIRAEISNRGAQLTSLQLQQHTTPSGEPVEMVRRRGLDPYPFALSGEGIGEHPLNSALYTLERGQDDEGRSFLHFRYRSDAGDAEKRFTLAPDGLIEVEARVGGSASWAVTLGPGLRVLDKAEKKSRYLRPLASYRRGEETETLVAKKVTADTYIPAQGLRWASLEDNHFLTAVLPREGMREVVVRPLRQRPEAAEDEHRFLESDDPAKEEEELSDELQLLLRADGERMRFLSFFGAKEYTRLAKMPYGLDETVRWGYLGFLARPLYLGLQWIHDHLVANYGWAIILMTVLIKLVFMPLTHKSQESMQKMQELNPKVQAVRAKFRNKLKDRQGRPNIEAQRQMQEEMMAVYKSAGVNPASGCFPMLLQIPVFIAFFQLLSTAVELRGAPWIGWIQDLSVPDPIFVLPAAMLVSSVAMQKLTPAPPDPMQRRMMQFMPIMFAVFAIGFPSGLVVYWVTNNLLTLAHQSFTLKQRKRREKAAG